MRIFTFTNFEVHFNPVHFTKLTDNEKQPSLELHRNVFGQRNCVLHNSSYFMAEVKVCQFLFRNDKRTCFANSRNETLSSRNIFFFPQNRNCYHSTNCNVCNV